MSRFVRASKYRHVFGQAAKKENGLENVRVSNNAWDTNLLSASAQYLSINYQVAGGGAFAILPLPGTELASGITYKLPDVIPLARGHSGPVLDTDWSPFDDRVVVSGGEDGKVHVWKIEGNEFDGWGGEKWVPQDFDPVAKINVSARKVGQVMFHPTASHVLATATGDHVVKLWDLASTDEPRSVLSGHGDTIQSIGFNTTGTLLATTCRDRKLRLFDPRQGGEAVRVMEGHGGVKSSRLVWMGETGKFATTGFSRMSDREVSVWDTASGDSPIKTLGIDQSSGVLMPFWSDNGIIFLAGKGDGNIRAYEWESDNLYALSEYSSTNPQRGLCFVPRRALNVSECEIARAYKVTGTTIEPVSFIVPRRSDSFQADIFPPAPSLEPALTAAEFFNGKTAARKLVDLDTGSVSSGPPPSAPASAFKVASPEPPKAPSGPTLSPEAVKLPSQVPLPKTPAVSEPVSAAPSRTTSIPVPTVSVSSDEDTSKLREENERLNQELRDARTQIRNLELQVETLKANAVKAKALLG